MTQEAYLEFFRTFAGIIEAALDDEAARTDGFARHAPTLSRLAAAVETLSVVRGDSAIFNTSRPKGPLPYQHEMYATEDKLRDKLLALGYVYPPR